MASQPVIVSAADLHVDAESVGGWDAENNRHSNWTESFRQFNTIIETCNEVDADFLVIAGDTFHTGRPKAEAVALLIAGLNRLDRTKAIFLNGNHDQQTVVGTHRTPIDAYLSGHQNVIHASSGAEVVEFDGVQFALVPWTRVAGASKLEETNNELDTIINRLGDQIDGKGPSMFAAHIVVDECTFDSGRRSSEVSMTTAVLEASVPTSLIDAGPWNIARLGHIHKRQQLSEKTGYIGSPYKVSFGEYKDSKGADIIRFSTKNKVTLEFKQFDVRELIKADISESGGENPTTIADLAKPGDIVRFILDAEGDPVGFQGALADLELKGIVPQVQRYVKERISGGIRLEGLSVDTEPIEAFKAYAFQQGLDKKQVKKLMNRFGTIVEEVHA